MNIINKTSDSVLNILDGFLQNPERQSTFEDLRLEVRESSETQIRTSLQELKRSQILMVDFKRGRPKGGCRTEIYTISGDWETFEKLFDIYRNHNYEKFLNSRYLNELVKSYGFIPIFRRVEKEFFDNNFKKVASNALMQQPAIIQEYENHPNILKEMPDSVVTGFPITTFEEGDLINMLSNLDLLTGIEFYRKKIGNTYIKLYRKFSNDNNYISEHIKEFIDLDIMLSPLTSYPVNDPIFLLFRRPYERIYNNAFILTPMDRYRFVRRAHMIYSHFAEILCSGINTLRINEMTDLNDELVSFEQKRRFKEINELDFRRYRPLIEIKSKRLNDLKNMQSNLETLVRLSIYHWNIAANRFDFIYNILDRYLHDQDYKNKYYIFEEYGDIKIVDLQDDKFNQNPVVGIRELIGDISMLSNLEDSFKQLLPCKAFGVDMNRKPITYDDILEEVRSKIKEPKLFSSGSSWMR